MTITTTRPTSNEAAGAGGRDWRSIIFRGVAGLVVLLLGASGSLMAVLAPWLLLEGSRPDYRPELHRWHAAQWGALTILLWGGTLLGLAWRPRRRPLLAQYLALTALAVLLLVAPFTPAVALVAAILGLVVLAYPALRELVSFRREGRVSRPLLALSLASAALLAADSWSGVRLQLTDHSEHAADFHWIIGAGVGVSLALAGLLTATRRPGWRALGIVTGLAYLYLGAAALALPAYDGSWGITGGVLALLGGAGYIAATLLVGRRSGRGHGSSPALLLVLVLGLLVAGCGQVAGARDHDGGFSDKPAAQTVEVRVDPTGRLAWEKAEYTTSAGDVTFVVSSPAGLVHNFGVEGSGVSAHSQPFAGGTTHRFTLTGLQPGTYHIVCTVPGHREAGMVATLRVR